jgi:hypothetical protein
MNHLVKNKISSNIDLSINNTELMRIIASAEFSLSSHYRYFSECYLSGKNAMIYKSTFDSLADEAYDHYKTMLSWYGLCVHNNDVDVYIPFNMTYYDVCPRVFVNFNRIDDNFIYKYFEYFVEAEESILELYKLLGKICNSNMTDFVESMICEEHKHVLELRKTLLS